LGDMISIDWDVRQNGLRFLKESAGARASVSLQLPSSMAQAAVAGSDGREIPVPSPKKVVAENSTSNGPAGSDPHKLARSRGKADLPKSKTQVERERVIAHPHR